MKYFFWVAFGVIGIFFISTTYHQNQLENAVKQDVNAETFVESKELSHEEISTSSKTENNNSESLQMTTNAENIAEESKVEEKENIEKGSKLEAISGSYDELSNATCAWGFVRKSNGQHPEFYGPHAKVLDNYQGIYVGNSDNKVLYLTFDEGYENGYSSSILDTLKEKGVKATFFVTMPYVKQNPDLVKRMISEGHIVGNHSVNHLSMPEVTDNEKVISEVMDLHNYMVENFDYEMSFFRPPKGEFSERTVKICLDLGYRHVLWSSAYADWDTNNQKGNEYAKNMICNNFHNGNVILLHAVSKDNASVLGEVIDEARNRGYAFVPLDEFEY